MGDLNWLHISSRVDIISIHSIGDSLSSHKSEIEKKDEAGKWNKDTKQVALAEIIKSKHTEP